LLAYAAVVSAFHADAIPGGLRRLTVAALLLVAGRSECDPPSPADEAAAAQSARDGCHSVVFVNCPLVRQQSTAANGPLSVTRQGLDARRLKEGPGQTAPNTIQITAERPTEAPPDPWETFGQSISSAATPDCLAPSMQGGLLRLPYLLVQATTGKCR
jgi:hypothetical protein